MKRVPADEPVDGLGAAGADPDSMSDAARSKATSEGEAHSAPLAEEDVLRADFYDFLSGLLLNAPDQAKLDRIAELSGDDTPIGEAVRALARLAAKFDAQAVEREFNQLFIGLGRGELLPYASYYLTGFLHEQPLSRLRGDMLALGMARAEGVFEPEDSIGGLCEMMAGLIRGRFNAPASLATQRSFFGAHIGPWAEHFFSDLEGAKCSVFYQPVGTLGRCMIEIDREAFRLEAEPRVVKAQGAGAA